MQSKNVIEVVAPLNGRISEVTSFPDEATILAGAIIPSANDMSAPILKERSE